MDPGRMDRRIELQAETETSDGMGGWIVETTTFATVWASVKQSGGREYLHADRIIDERRAVFTVHWRGDITTETTVLWDGDTWDVHEVREIGRRAGLELHCTSTA